MSGPSVLHCSGAVGWATGRTSNRKMVARLLVVTIWSCARLIAPVVTTTSVILSSNKIQKGNVLVPSNPDPSGKWPLKRRERVSGPSHKKLFSHAAYRLHSATLSYQGWNVSVRLSAIPLLLVQPFTRTDISRCAFQFSAPYRWNLLLQTVLISDSSDQ